MERYIEFNPLKFINESPGWDDEIRTQKKRLAAIIELRGQTDSVGKGSSVSNPTETINIAKAEIEGQIKRLEYYKQVYRSAWKHLNKEEQMMIDGFFFKKYGKVRDFVNDYAKEHCTNKSYVYDARKSAINTFSEYIKDAFLY